MTDFSKTECPDCGAALEHHPGCRTWCPACDWNLAPDPAPPEGPLEATYRALGRKAGQQLFSELRSSSPAAMKPRLTLTSALAFVLAGLVHLATLALFLVGLWCIQADWFNWFLALIGALLVLAAWGLAPKPARKPDHILGREAAPALHAMADRVARALCTRPVDTICASPEVNAWYGHYGWRRRKVLTLGAPLWLCLDPDQKLALVAHELAHQVNRDIARTRWVGSALDALGRWIDFLWQPYNTDRTLFELLALYLMNALAIPAQGVYSALMHLFWRESQRAEYLADHLGARAAGTAAFVALLERMALAAAQRDAMDFALRSHADDPENIIPDFITRVAALPPVEILRVRRELRRELTTLDATHPPTHYRAELLRAFPCPATVAKTAEEARRTDAEIAALGKELGRALVRGDPGRS